MDINLLCENPLALALVFSLGIQVFFYIIAAIKKTDTFTDLSYGISFFITAWVVLLFSQSPTFPKWMLVAMITLWGIRLAGYLFIRILATKKDKRFDGIREDPIRFGIFWLFQGISVWVILLPSTLLLGNSTEDTIFPLATLGSFIWLAGLAIETIADYQKFEFKKKNKSGFISEGLWKYSRHPNYFGELLCWWGIFVFTIPYLSGYEYLSFLGPVWITVLLLFVTGIPTIEKRYDKKYAKDKAFQKYRKNTSLLIPLPPKS